jgi:putative glutamine amidotransferase
MTGAIEGAGLTGAVQAGAARPVIGISAYSEQARWGVWDRQATLLPQNYVDHVTAAGGVAVLLPPVPGIEAIADRLDGLIISGGPDVEPARYGHQPGPHTVVTRPGRDAAELALFRAMHQAGRPVLGICRGMQLINVALGGTLIQHLPDEVGHDGHSPYHGAYGEHKVSVTPSSCLAGLLFGEQAPVAIAVPTHHHQSVGTLADGLVATAWAEDGTIEAFEADGAFGSAGAPFTIAVQWHPEAGDDASLFRALVAAASGVVSG